ncbi:MAG TPA: hypothetical protein VJL84_02025 [Kiloniellales bacterium]|nr:hypothetical protein [Kiloniellales bacterium]
MSGSLRKLIGVLLLLAAAGIVGVQAVVTSLDAPPAATAPS